MTSTRDRLLDSVEVLLVGSGPGSVTLDAVATATAVSKGGLLYHFRTKEALFAGLLERVRVLGEEDVAAMRAHDRGPVAFYLSTALLPDEPAGLHRTMLAVVGLASAGHAGARESLAELSAAWYAVLLEAVGDAELARVVQLVGDGLWNNASLGTPVGDVDSLLATVEHLLERAGVGPGAALPAARA